MNQSLRRLWAGAVLMAALVTIASSIVFAQEFTGEIRGTVKDRASGESLVGANILVVGTNKGTTTNFEGAFSIKGLPPGQYTIVARFVGYVRSQQTVTVAANAVAEVNFQLDQDVLRIDEVVVTGLSGEIPRAELGNSISKISGSQIEKVVTTNIMDALAAKAPGLQTTRGGGTPGAGVYVTIRGRHTITGSSQPLYVVDGVIIDNTTWQLGTVQAANRGVDINPNDIESIEILKGASASAIYGSRAANGVVLITTKSGKAAAPGKFARINYTTSFTSEEVPSKWPLQTKYGQRIPYAPYQPGSTDSWGAPLPAGAQIFDQSKVIFRRGQFYENTLTVSGGNPAFKYLVSGTLTNQQGLVINSDLDKRSIRANLSYTVLDNLSFSSNSNYVSSLTNIPQDGSNTSGILLSALRSPPNFDLTKYLEDDGVTQRRYGAYDNPLWSLHFNKNWSQLSRFIHSTGFEWDILSGLRFSGRLGLDRYDQGLFQRLFTGAAASPAAGGAISHGRVTNNIVNTELLLTAKHQLSSDFLLTFVGGQQLTFTKTNITNAGSTSTLPFFDEIGAGSTPSASSSRSETRVFGYFGQVTANMFDRLTVTGALRYDGSSTFGEEKRWFLYPKASVSYRISEESFMRDLKGIIDEFKLRGAWGVSGLQPGAYVTNYLYLSAGNFDPWGRGTSSNRLGQSGFRNSFSAGNNQLRPEKTTEIEAGFDLTMMDRRINLEFSWYTQAITDLLLFTPVSPSTGYTSQIRNAGSMDKDGFEVKLEVAPIFTDDIQWTLGVNYSQNKTMVTELQGYTDDQFVTLAGAFAGIFNIAKKGHPLGVFYGLGWERGPDGKIVHSDPANGIADNVLGGSITGAPRYSSTQLIIGNPNPKWTGAIRTDLTLFQDITFSTLFDIVWDFDVWNGTNGALYNFGTAKDTEDRDDLWFNENGQPVVYTGTTPRTIGTRTYQPGEQLRREVYYRFYANGFNINEPHIYDGSYVKWRDLSISYRLRAIPFFNLESITFSISARNLATWTDYPGYDPEVNHFNQSEGRGYDYFNYPQVRSYRFGISINY
ncbi:MAG TPA: SusC/RagA family TonB-linked outer membrane protein [Bacteroidota bacterium]|nr:SusC/RagA family TonB-linked outer membrane protein [Bacteroidota bacterium]